MRKSCSVKDAMSINPASSFGRRRLTPLGPVRMHGSSVSRITGSGFLSLIACQYAFSSASSSCLSPSPPWWPPGTGRISLADDVHDVPVRILEPGGLDVIADVHVAFAGQPRHVVMLELDALVPERLDFVFDVVHR